MRSLGQNPTQPQIDAIIRDMDLDNDGVIDLAEFMIRMMALTTKVGFYYQKGLFKAFCLFWSIF